jgi:hypothetical protein
VGDGGLCALAGATRLTLHECGGVAGEHLAPLGAALQELAVAGCVSFTGGGLASLAALRRLSVRWCPAFRAGSLADIAGSCPALERVDVAWCGAPAVDAAAEAAPLAAAAAGGGAWTFFRTAWAWAATRPPPQRPAAPAPPAGPGGGAANQRA